MQTLDLGHKINDASLEGVLLGLVFTSRQDSPIIRGQRPLRSIEAEPEIEKQEERRARELECLDEAIRNVGKSRQMEGMIEFPQGRLSFLLYRVD